MIKEIFLPQPFLLRYTIQFTRLCGNTVFCKAHCLYPVKRQKNDTLFLKILLFVRHTVCTVHALLPSHPVGEEAGNLHNIFTLLYGTLFVLYIPYSIPTPCWRSDALIITQKMTIIHAIQLRSMIKTKREKK